MILHPLTKELLSARFEYSPDRDEVIDKMVRGYLEARRAWLEANLSAHGYENTAKSRLISQAFQLAPETLEEKFKAIRLKHDGNYPIPGDFWDVVLKDFAVAAEEHFSNQPLAQTVSCNVQQTPRVGGTY